MIDVLYTCNTYICVTVPGATESDYPLNDDEIQCDTSSSTPTADPAPDGSTPTPEGEGEGEGTDTLGIIGGVTFVQCATGAPNTAECPQVSSTGKLGKVQ